MIKRIIDLVSGYFLFILPMVPMLFIAIAIRLTSEGKVLYWSDRVGKNNVIFRIHEFRSMRVDTTAVATDLISNTETFLTPIGGFIRRSSLDEPPQLFSVLRVI